MTRTLWLLLLTVPAPGADYYKLENIKRVEKDLYKADKLLIQTKYCYHYTYGETAILKLVGQGDLSSSTITWDDDSKCDVRKILSVD